MQIGVWELRWMEIVFCTLCGATDSFSVCSGRVKQTHLTRGRKPEKPSTTINRSTHAARTASPATQHAARSFRSFLRSFLCLNSGEDAANPSSSSGVEGGLAWLRDFFRREAAESKVFMSGNKGTAEGEQEPLDQEQREIGVKR